jgi:hypothetical protein
MDTAATRRAILAVARAESMAEIAGRASSEPLHAKGNGRLTQAIGEAAVGDCLKGDHFLGGGGLLSLPFFIAAELRGQCSR